MEYHSVLIPVKTYVRKYIEGKYPQPMVLSVKNLMGTVIFSILSKDKIKNHSKKGRVYTNTKFSQLNDSINVLVPNTGLNKKDLQPCKIKATFINDLFAEKIEEDIYTSCTAYQVAGLTMRRAIEDFANRYGIIIGTEISFDSLKKAEYRRRKKLQPDKGRAEW